MFSSKDFITQFSLQSSFLFVVLCFLCSTNLRFLKKQQSYFSSHLQKQVMELLIWVLAVNYCNFQFVHRYYNYNISNRSSFQFLKAKRSNSLAILVFEPIFHYFTLLLFALKFGRTLLRFFLFQFFRFLFDHLNHALSNFFFLIPVISWLPRCSDKWIRIISY